MAQSSGKQQPNKAKSDARQERLAQALRANLRRRKGQKKARTVEEDVNSDDGDNKPEGS